MQKSKLFEALAYLDAAEMKRFQFYVHSPYHNKHSRLAALVDIIATEYPHFSSDCFSKPALFAALFPNEKFNGQKVSDLFTYMLRLLEDFLAQETYNEAQKQLDTLTAMRKKGMDYFFERNVKRLSKKDKAPDFISDEELYVKYKLEHEADLYFTGKDSRVDDKSLEKKSRELDHFYMVAKLRQACEAANRQNIVKEQYNIRYIENLQQIIAENDYLLTEVPAIDIHRHILLTLTKPEIEANYFGLIALLQLHETRFVTDELRSMYDYAQNYCIKKINTGKTEFVDEVFKIYQLLLANGVIYIDNELSQWDYKNIVTVGTRLKEYEWTEQFIEDYKARLPETDRENAYAYNLANYYYSRQLYHKALELLRDVEFTDVYYGLGARSLLLKVYYEAEEYDPLYSLVESFKIYLKRNTLVSEYQYKAHFNLVRFTKYMTDLRLRLVSSNKETLNRDLSRVVGRTKIAGDITNAAWVNNQLTILDQSINKTKQADANL